MDLAGRQEVVVEAIICASSFSAHGQSYNPAALWDERLGVVTAEVAGPSEWRWHSRIWFDGWQIKHSLQISRPVANINAWHGRSTKGRSFHYPTDACSQFCPDDSRLDVEYVDEDFVRIRRPLGTALPQTRVPSAVTCHNLRLPHSQATTCIASRYQPQTARGESGRSEICRWAARWPLPWCAALRLWFRKTRREIYWLHWFVKVPGRDRARSGRQAKAYAVIILLV